MIELRSPVGVWIAERFEALNTQEMLASGEAEGGITSGRSSRSGTGGSTQRFEKVAMRIADRRVRAATDTELDTFRPVP